jgi:hypothetical protein
MRISSYRKFCLLTLLSLVMSHSLRQVEEYNVELVVFSGTPNPEWKISQFTYDHLLSLVAECPQVTFSKKVMGYQGFLITDLTNGDFINFVRGCIDAEEFLLESITTNHLIPRQVTEHILEEIHNTEIDMDNSPFFITSKNGKCDSTPLRGPDTVPVYDPKTDDQGCFQTKQSYNNCYNYGTDVLTNTFAQPGRGTQHKWTDNTCEAMRVAALSDGLEYIGKELPTEKPETGHFIALLIWPNTNFHWIRLDSNGQWSHKPGSTAVKNKDNNGKLITDPSKQDFSPWSQFCAYYRVLPSGITIN